MLYTAGTIALACLETVVHLNSGNLPLNRDLVRLDVPDDVRLRARRLNALTAPVDWNSVPAGKVSLDVGDG